MMFTVLSIAALAATSSAAAVPGRFPFNTDIAQQRIELFNVPLSNGSAELPGFGDLKVRSITIGRGTQNYTCASSTAADRPRAIGAVATLYDGSAFIPPDADINRGDTILAQLPDIIFPVDRDLLDRFLPIAGQHYFNANGSPVFDVRQTSRGILTARAAANITAPPPALKGEFGVIPWLKLDPVDGSDGLRLGYRTVTAGGSPPQTCEGREPTFEIQYAAQYFFYN